MGDRQQEIKAAVELILQLADQHAGELKPDVDYARELVLAAPDLLDACQKIIDCAAQNPADFNSQFEPFFKTARRAIAKAQG